MFSYLPHLKLLLDNSKDYSLPVSTSSQQARCGIIHMH